MIEIKLVYLIVLAGLFAIYSIIDAVNYINDCADYEKEIENLKKQLEEEKKIMYIEYIRLDE